MDKLSVVNNFVDTMIEEEANLKQIQQQISNTEESIKGVVTKFDSNQKNIVNSIFDSEICKQDETVKEKLSSITKNLEETMSGINDEIKKGIVGMKFIEDFEKQFTVAVFGKVKAGKSFLGNFIKGNPFTKNNIKTSYDKLGDIKVTVYDKGKVTEQTNLSTEDEFGVNMKEATSTIQYFSLGGMVWFDTPGIGSVTWENEMLAKDYVTNSDLVLYCCNSDAAGTTQDFAELKALHEIGKPVLILLTQSDTTDYDDEGDEILCKKSDKDRKDMEEYMLETISENGLDDLLKHSEILTVSSLLAKTGFEEDNQQLFDDSNIGLLLDKLSSITKTEAAEFKRKTPSTRINELILNINKKLENLEVGIKDYFVGMSENKKELNGKKEMIIERAKADVNSKVLMHVNAMKSKIDSEGGSISGDELSSEVSNIVNESIQNLCAKEISIQVNRLPSISIGSVGDMKMQTSEVEYTQTIKSRRELQMHELGFIDGFRNIWGKKFYKTETENITKVKSYDIGINSSTICSDIMSQLDVVFRNDVDRYFEDIFDTYYRPVENLQSVINAEIKRTTRELEGLKL